jgi:two-component system, OmpR family, sensor histidine kinase KdpD
MPTKWNFAFVSAPIASPVAEALEELKQPLVQHPVDVRIPANLPNARMDPAHIKEVLVHLIENAAKYSPAGAPIRITAEAKEQRPMLTISIADRGPGIDDFEQSWSSKSSIADETSACKSTAPAWGWPSAKPSWKPTAARLGVTSQLGHGSVFYFSLPRIHRAATDSSGTSGARSGETDRIHRFRPARRQTAVAGLICLQETRS